MTINTSHANIVGGITNDVLDILDITDSLYTNDTLDTIDIYYTRGKLIPIAITILVILAQLLIISQNYSINKL